VRWSVRPREYSLRADQEGIIPVCLTRSDLPGDAPIGSPTHPSRLRGWRAIRPVVVRLQLPAQAPQSQVGTAHGVGALAGVAEPVALAAGEKPARSIEPGHLPAAIHAIAVHVADEPGPRAPEAAGRPPYRHRLVRLLPFLALDSRSPTSPQPITATMCDQKRPGAIAILFGTAKRLPRFFCCEHAQPGDEGSSETIEGCRQSATAILGSAAASRSGIIDVRFWSCHIAANSPEPRLSSPGGPSSRI
jgi:hypothetical protein